MSVFVINFLICKHCVFSDMYCLYYLAPVIIVDVKDQTQVEEYSVNFTCQATGEPVPTISWYFNDVPVNMSTDKHNISTMSVNVTSINSRLIVKSVESSDVGTYTCKATNILSTDISSGVLSVNGM